MDKWTVVFLALGAVFSVSAGIGWGIGAEGWAVDTVLALGFVGAGTLRLASQLDA